jgi:hypothetical protein
MAALHWLALASRIRSKAHMKSIAATEAMQLNIRNQSI